jgi:uracil-DNA glycosylase
VHWARQGVLLLNTCLTVEEGRPASHAGKGWEVLTDAIIRQVSAGTEPVVFMLWGAHAQSKRPLIDGARHRVLCANHPSPLSALRPPLPFMGCGHFSLARDVRQVSFATA